jgi:hypothetical protein
MNVRARPVSPSWSTMSRWTIGVALAVSATMGGGSPAPPRRSGNRCPSSR